MSFHYPIVTVRAYGWALSSIHMHLKMLWQVHGAETRVEKDHLQKNHTGECPGKPMLSFSNHKDIAVSTAKANRYVLSYSGVVLQEADAVAANVVSVYRVNQFFPSATSLLSAPEVFFSICLSVLCDKTATLDRT